MLHLVLRAFVVIGVLGVWAMAVRRGASAATPSVLGVRQLDVGYRLGDRGLKLRATLVTGESLEYSTNDTREVQAILEVAQACGLGQTAMSAVLEGGTLRAIQCSIKRDSGH